MPYPHRSPRLPLLAGLLFALLLSFTAAACVEGEFDGEGGGDAGARPTDNELRAADDGSASVEEPAVASQRPQADSPFTLGRGRADLTVEAAVPSTAALGEDDEYRLVLDDLVLLAPGAYYEVYLDLPEGTEPDPEGPYFLGNLSLFGLTPEQLEEGEEPVRHSASFDVSETVRELAGRSGWDGELRLTFVRGNPAPATASAEPSDFIRVGKVSLIHPG